MTSLCSPDPHETSATCAAAPVGVPAAAGPLDLRSHQPRRSRIASLQRQGDFSRIYKQGRRFRAGLLTAVVSPGAEPGVRAAFVVSKKVARQAVRRNRIRRRLRESFRSLLASEADGVDIIIIAHREAAEADYWQLYAALGEVLRRARLSLRPPTSASVEGSR